MEVVLGWGLESWLRVMVLEMERDVGILRGFYRRLLRGKSSLSQQVRLSVVRL